MNTTITKTVMAVATLLLTQLTIAQVGIGTTTPNADAELDIVSTNRGLLMPRVNLTSTILSTPMTAHVAGMTVYNLNTNLDVTPGFYYNNGTIWVRIGGGAAPNNDWALAGNSGTTPGTNFVGTTDNVDLHISRQGSDQIRLTTNEVIINENGDDRDLRIESVGVPNMFLLDASQNEILVNTPGAGSHPYPDDPLVSYTNFVLPSGSTTNSFAVTGWNSGDTGGGGNFQNTNVATAYAAMEASTNGTGNAVTANAFGPAGSTGAGVSGHSTEDVGVRGYTSSRTAGTDFDLNNNKGVWGTLSYTNTSGTSNTAGSFGVVGTVGDGGLLTNYSRRTGGVLGSNLYARGALGYYAGNGNDYAVYGFGGAYQNGGAGGRNMAQTDLDTFIGLGIHGGVMGGWIKGKTYGAMFSGDRFGSYIHGKSITNDTYVVLDEKENGSKIATYASTSMSIDVQSRGVGNLNNGVASISFDKAFQQLVDTKKPIIVTVTPIGESNGVHIVRVGANGFSIKENLEGKSSVQFNWVAIAEKRNKEEKISKEILSANFDENTQKLMHHEEDDEGLALWTENGNIQFGTEAPFNPEKLKVKRLKKDTTTTRVNK